MAKNNNLIPNLRGKTEAQTDKQKLYHKLSGKKSKTQSAPAPQENRQQRSTLQNRQVSGQHAAAQSQPQKTARTAGSSVKKTLKSSSAQSRQIPSERKAPAQQKPREIKTTPLKIFSLGGLNEIGKNIYVYECANDIFVIDCGLAFPDDEMPGIDSVIPDFTYLEKNKQRVRGVVLDRKSVV